MIRRLTDSDSIGRHQTQNAGWTSYPPPARAMMREAIAPGRLRCIGSTAAAEVAMRGRRLGWLAVSALWLGCSESVATDRCAGVVCAAPGACALPGSCDPATGTCVYAPRPRGTACRVAVSDCDAIELCDGVSDACPANVTCTVAAAPLSDCGATGRTCRNVAPAAAGGFTLGSLSYPLPPSIYVAVTNKNEVAKLDTETGQKLWQVPTYGAFPSRVAVALDGTAWVGNRCLSGGAESDFNCSNVVHLDSGGNLICRGDVPGWVRGVAIDRHGDVVAGTYNGFALWKISGVDVNASQTPPRCRILGSVDVGVPVYGVAVDARGFAWTASSPTVKVDLAAMQVAATIPNPSYYGIAVDRENRIWFGGWNVPGGIMHRIDGDAPYARLDVPNTVGVSAVTVAPDGTVWGSSYGGSPPGLVKVTLAADGQSVEGVQWFADPEGFQNHGVAVDAAGMIWAPQVWLKGTINRWTPEGSRDARFTVDPGQELYSYSDMTGAQLRSFTIQSGAWAQQVDGGPGEPSWSEVAWTAAMPPGATVEVRTRAATAPEDFAAGTATEWCGPATVSPADLGACPQLAGKRWLEVELALATTSGGRPTVSDVRVVFTE